MPSIEILAVSENFKKQFSDAGAKQFGSIWLVLVTDASGKLKVGSTANQDNPFNAGNVYFRSSNFGNGCLGTLII